MSKNIRSKTTFNSNFSSIKGKVPSKSKETSFSIFILKECSKHTSDPFWKKKLNEASIGIFPKFFSYKNGSLIFSNGKDNVETVELSNDPIESCKIFINFLKKCGKMFSPTEINNLVEIEIPEEPQIKLWSTYKKKDKEHMIDMYVEQVKLSLSLSDSEENELFRKILEGLNAGAFKGKTLKDIAGKNIKDIQNEESIIIDSDNRIVNIKGINFSSKTRKFTFDEKIEKQIVSKFSHKENVPINYKKTTNLISSRWKKYLEILDKNKKRQETIIVNIEEETSDNSDID